MNATYDDVIVTTNDYNSRIRPALVESKQYKLSELKTEELDSEIIYYHSIVVDPAAYHGDRLLAITNVVISCLLKIWLNTEIQQIAKDELLQAVSSTESLSKFNVSNKILLQTYYNILIYYAQPCGYVYEYQEEIHVPSEQWASLSGVIDWLREDNPTSFRERFVNSANKLTQNSREDVIAEASLLANSIYSVGQKIGDFG